jgi:hypothetical protein
MKLELTKEQADLIVGSLYYANYGDPAMNRGRYHDRAKEIIQLINKEKENAE